MPRKDGTGRQRTGGGGRMGGNNPGSGPSGFCVCPNCGTKVPHQRGIPCYDMTCPQCKSSLVKE